MNRLDDCLFHYWIVNHSWIYGQLPPSPHLINNNNNNNNNNDKNDRETMKDTKPPAIRLFAFFQELDAIFLLAFIGGFVDAAGYLKFDQLFTASVTGNLVAACASVYLHYGVVARITVSAAFILGGMVGYYLAMTLKKGKEKEKEKQWNMREIGCLLFLIELILFLITFAIGLNYDEEMHDHGNSLSDWRVGLTASFMGGTMGIHNAAAKLLLPTAPATTVVTMTLLAESQYLADFFANHFWVFFANDEEEEEEEEGAVDEGNQETKRREAKRLKKQEEIKEFFSKWFVVSRPLIAFLIGAIIGVVLISNITYYCLIVPMFILIMLIMDLYLSNIMERKKEEYRMRALKSVVVVEQSDDGGKQLEIV